MALKLNHNFSEGETYPTTSFNNPSLSGPETNYFVPYKVELHCFTRNSSSS